jgi:hypothetical protein
LSAKTTIRILAQLLGGYAGDVQLLKWELTQATRTTKQKDKTMSNVVCQLCAINFCTKCEGTAQIVEKLHQNCEAAHQLGLDALGEGLYQHRISGWYFENVQYREAFTHLAELKGPMDYMELSIHQKNIVCGLS